MRLYSKFYLSIVDALDKADLTSGKEGWEWRENAGKEFLVLTRILQPIHKVL